MMKRPWKNTNRPPPLSANYAVNFLYAPFGKDGATEFIGEIVINVFLELFAVFMLSFWSPPQSPISIGLYISLVIFVASQLQYGDRLPRYLTPGAAVTALLEGRISWFFSILYLAVGFLAATLVGVLLYATGASSVGLPDNIGLGSIVMIQLCFTSIIAFMRKRQRRTITEDAICSIIIALVVAVFHHTWGIWAFSSYIYYADFVKLILLKEHYALNKIEFPAVRILIPGIIIMFLFLLMDVFGHIVAMILDVLVFRVKNKKDAKKKND